MVSDNGTFRDFKHFCNIYVIEHLTTLIYHPKLNGQAERFVDTFKKALRNARGWWNGITRIFERVSNDVKCKRRRECHLQSSWLLEMLDTFLTNYCQGIKIFRDFNLPDHLKENWQKGKIIQRLDSIRYMVDGGWFLHKRHINQLTFRYAQNKQPIQFYW